MPRLHLAYKTTKLYFRQMEEKIKNIIQTICYYSKHDVCVSEDNLVFTRKAVNIKVSLFCFCFR